MTKKLGSDRNIAVIVPVYNTGKSKLTECIHSILTQTHRNITLILVDDGSTDESGRICDRFTKRDDRIEVIHQVNAGSLEARKAGILSSRAQATDYLCIVDSDDVMPRRALEKLVAIAERENADCVCGKALRYWRGIPLPQRNFTPCFSSGKAKAYTNEEIISELYVSCFGYTNYPVTLWAKLYRTALITQVADYPAFVRFMGDDLSVTLRLLPITQKLVIIPDIVYYYRFGGGTSKFMPDMLEDFLKLYRFKKEMAVRYPMPQNVDRLMAAELIHVAASWLEMCTLSGRYTPEDMRNEIARICQLPEMQSAARQEDLVRRKPTGLRKAIEKSDVDAIEALIADQITKNKLRRKLRAAMA